MAGFEGENIKYLEALDSNGFEGWRRQSLSKRIVQTMMLTTRLLLVVYQDHMRRAGDVCFSQVFRDRDGMRGIVDYTDYEDMKYAIRKLDDSLFRNQFSRAYIRVEEYAKRGRYSRSPSRSPYRSRSRSLSYSSGSRSRSTSPWAKRSRRSPTRSRSRSVSRSRSPVVSSARGKHVRRSPESSLSRSLSRSISRSPERSY